MIKEKTVTMNINSRNVTFYKNKGYKTKVGESVEINVSDLSENSHYLITAVCQCGEESKIRYHKYLENIKRHNYYGCKKCSNAKRELSSIEKWGVTNYMKTDECKNKIAENNINKYGVKTTLLEEKTKQKIDKKIFELYNVKNILSSKDIREKGRQTLLNTYGVDHYSKTIDFYNKTYKRWENDALNKLNKYNIKDFVLKKDRTIDIKCDCGMEHYFNITTKNLYQRKEIQNNILCTICNSIINQTRSGQEIQLVNFIKENYSGLIIENDKTITSELDIYLPELKIAFEYNGIYWHSDLYKNKDYHLNKTEICEKNNIMLIHIYEDDWINKQSIVKSRILNLLNKTTSRIYARNCQIKIIENKKTRDFLEINHIQGFVGSSIKIGLFYKNELVSLMTFGKLRKNMGLKAVNNSFELLRFCNKLNTSVVGAASKLLKFFIKNYNVNEIITYADRSWSNGNMYHKIGFELVAKTAPNYNYYDSKGNKYNRFNFRKDKLVKEGYDKNKTEFEIMDDLGYLRVFNSGNLKFKLKLFD